MSDTAKFTLLGIWVAFWLSVYAWTFTDSFRDTLTPKTGEASIAIAVRG